MTDLATRIANSRVHRRFDFTTTVTLWPENEGWFEEVSYVTQTRLSKHEASMFGPAVLEQETKKFSLYVAELNGRVPEQGYRITDANDVVWQIVSADLSTLGSRYLCYCYKTRLTHPPVIVINDVLIDTEAATPTALQDTEGDDTILTDSEA